MNQTDRHLQLSWLIAVADIALFGGQSVFAYHRLLPRRIEDLEWLPGEKGFDD
jgi:hypothetical protein